MPNAEVNGVRIYHALHGAGEPLALVHGSWADATGWAFVAPVTIRALGQLAG
jgi:pimeloyl-ACP methyl ester carboxylesterase